MRDLTPSSPKPGSALRRSGHNATLLTGLIALFAMVVIGVAAPNLSDLAHGSAVTTPHAASPTPPAARADASVPGAADAFAQRAPSGDTFGMIALPSRNIVRRSTRPSAIPS